MTEPREAEDLLALDRYLDGLLAGAYALERSGTPGGTPDAAARVDPSIAAAAQRLRRDLVRIHPSFRFEERLAARLAAAATGRRVAAGAEGLVVPFRGARSPGDGGPEDELLGAIAAGDVDPAADRRPAPSTSVLLGGALTSAALSLAGVAWVAWRASQRASRRDAAMRRAVRAARRASREGQAAVDLARRARLP